MSFDLIENLEQRVERRLAELLGNDIGGIPNAQASTLSVRSPNLDGRSIPLTAPTLTKFLSVTHGEARPALVGKEQPSVIIIQPPIPQHESQPQFKPGISVPQNFTSTECRWRRKGFISRDTLFSVTLVLAVSVIAGLIILLFRQREKAIEKLMAAKKTQDTPKKKVSNKRTGNAKIEATHNESDYSENLLDDIVSDGNIVSNDRNRRVVVDVDFSGNEETENIHILPGTISEL